MNQQPTPLTIDADQWRRDIKTFAETTSLALDAIVAQLSNSCSGDLSNHEPESHRRQGSRDLPTQSKTTFASGDTRGDSRLADLKTQLADRISKSN